jgi:hypothetical protein
MSKAQKGVFRGKLIRRMDVMAAYELGITRAKFSIMGKAYGYNRNSGFLYGFCPKRFEKTTGIKLAIGEEVMVEITIKTTPIKGKK